MDIHTALAHYMDHQRYFRNLSPHSIYRTRVEVEQFSKITRTRNLSDITDETIHRYFFIGISERHWKGKSQNTKRLTLNPFFKWCVSKGYMFSNPMGAIPYAKQEQPLPKSLTKTEAQRLLDMAYNLPSHSRYLRLRNHAIIALCLYTGLRKFELADIKCSDIDLANLIVHVRNGKGRKERVIPMSRTLRDILKQYMEERTRLGTLVPHLFTAKKGTTGIAVATLETVIKKVRRASGIPFSAVILRHSFATFMLEGGSNLFAISKMMGHTSVLITSMYLDARVEHLRAEIFKHPLN